MSSQISEAWSLDGRTFVGTEVRFPEVLSIGDAKSLYDHLRTETSGGANDRRTAIDIQIIRASMDAQGATVR